MLSINGDMAVKLIREQGVGGLCYFDGCLCSHFAIHHIHVDVSCRKSSGLGMFKDFYGIGIRVHSHSMDVGGEDLYAVAQEVVGQLEGEGYDIKVRFCSYEDDKKKRCTYCHKPRGALDDYLCAECLEKNDPIWGSVAENHDYRKWESRIKTARKQLHQSNTNSEQTPG